MLGNAHVLTGVGLKVAKKEKVELPSFLVISLLFLSFLFTELRTLVNNVEKH